MNILFTCAGRRNYLINYFKTALKDKGKVIAADFQLSAPALVDADIALKLPSIYSDNYVDSLIKLISEQKVNAIISLNDLELPILSEHKDKIEKTGAKVIISDSNVIDIAFDKWKTYEFFESINIRTPKTYIDKDKVIEDISLNKLSYPLVVKPRWGSASIGIDIVEDERELLLSYELQLNRIKKSILKNASSKELDSSIVIQEKINGEEYGIDILNDFDGDFYGSFTRKKLAMRSGETDKAVSIINSKFSDAAKKIAEHTNHIGNMDCDFFVSNDEIYFLEMNPRFGGGYPFSHEAGIDTPSIYVSWLEGKSDVQKYDNYKDGIAFSKYDQLMNIPIEKI